MQASRRTRPPGHPTTARWPGAVSRRKVVGLAAAGLAAVPASAAAQDGTGGHGLLDPAAGARPASGTERQVRGAGGELRLLQYQVAQSHNALAWPWYSDHSAAALVLEPLMHYLPDGKLVANLVTEVPTVENGLLAPDLSSVTYRLLPGVTWSDGEPFTANDVRFTWEWNLDVEVSSSLANRFANRIDAVDVLDDLTVTVRFAQAEPIWFDHHTGTFYGFIYPAHVVGNPDFNPRDFGRAPVGTGPYVVEEMSPERIAYVINERYREPGKPYFSRIVTDQQPSHPRAVETFLRDAPGADYDFCWRLDGNPEEVKSLAAANEAVRLVLAPSGDVQGIDLNLSDPRTEVDGQVSHKDTPHPFLSDPTVREAIAHAIDRDAIADKAYFGIDLEPPATSILEAFPGFQPSSPPVTYDPDRASQLLDDAGWFLIDGVRERDGISLEVQYTAQTGEPQATTMETVKANLEAVGFRVETRPTDGAILWSNSPGNDLSWTKFPTDFQEYQAIPDAPIPFDVLRQWYAGPDGENIPQRENQWSGSNSTRYVNPDYDALYEQALTETDPEVLSDLCARMNDMLFTDHVTIPLGHRRTRVACVRTLNAENFAFGPFSHFTWNIANWNREPEE